MLEEMNSVGRISVPPYSIPVRGYSLLETIVTIAVLGVLVTLAAPTFTALIAKNRVLAAAETILSDLRWARSEAIKRNVKVRVVFDPGNPWSYRVYADPGSANTLIKTFNGTTFPGSTLTSASFGSGSYTTFDPIRGINPNNGRVVLDMDDFSATVTVSTLGRARICDAPGGYEPCP
ncbi:MAG: GspH/FimT family pseudopilin [Chromatiaceae bacterium]|nr:GspH/FimT family pseudopilin [Chromatiaceae bacterium]MCF7994408.1 GspH/FimT family pseudopilin [Chromatiaceae bacterium]MCF8014223.1 GspH/FimT family pseudopilin [Chromatiaceae bacterium]